MFGKRRQESSDIFTEVENMEQEYELAFAVTGYRDRSRREGKWANEMYKAWKWQIFDVRSWTDVQEPAAAVPCEFRDAGIK